MRNLSIACRMLAVLILSLCCASCGPRMNKQVSIHPYQQRMPVTPTGTVPANGSLKTYSAREAKLTANPLPNTPVNMRNGKIYYGYYCLMCHGEGGDGNGPVGQSYVPKPADLSSPKIAALNDGQLYDHMLHGVGHDPVLMQTVQPGQRWPLVMYVRQFAATTQP
jgi:hypothetical protein